MTFPTPIDGAEWTNVTYRKASPMAKRLFLCPLLLIATSICTAELPTDGTPLRIMTFNAEILTAPGVTAGQLEHYRFDYAREQLHERVAAVIEALDPDILNLVEVTSKESVDLLIKKLHEKGLTQYEGHHVESGDSFTGMDVAVIAKFKPDLIDGKTIRNFISEPNDPTWREFFTAPDRSGSPRRQNASLSRHSVYYFTLGGHKLGFLGLHLKSNPQDEYSNARRTAEADIAGRILRAEIVPRGYLPIVLGDLNDYDPDVPDRDDSRSPTTNVLRDLKNFDRERTGPELVNVAERMPRQADRYTSHWDWNENGAHDGDDVYTMIDHILLPAELAPYIQKAFIAHIVGPDTSDHYPVVVDLLLPPVEAAP